MSAFATARRSARLLSRRWRCSKQNASRTAAVLRPAAFNATPRAFWIAPTEVRWFSASSSSSEAVAYEEEEEEPETRYFFELDDLNPKTLSVLERQGIQSMTEIQAKTWDAVSKGKDVLGRSRTGSGKTLAFLLPALERIIASMEENNNHGIRMLIISPTRELATQIHKTAEQLTQAHRRTSSHVLYGGVPKGKDLQRLDRQLPTILTATPGRLMDHLENSYLRDSNKPFADTLANVDVLVLDEMDRLLDMGFREDVRRILQYMPHKSERQTLLFSATVPPTVQKEIRACLQSGHDTVDCIQEEDPSTHTVKTVQQSHVVLPPTKLVTGVVEVILQLLEQSQDSKVIVFFNTTSQVSFFATLFRKANLGHHILELHSKINQGTRSKTSDRFRNLKSGILFTSDVSARGVDYPDVTHVVQMGAASDRETYIHRLGRTGRAGKSGEGILVLLDKETHGVLGRDLRGIDIPRNDELQDLLDSSENYQTAAMEQWLPRTLRDYDMAKKANDCYRSLVGFYFQRFKGLGVRQPKDQVVDMINAFAQQAGLEERPSISAKVVQQYGLTNHPGITVRQPSQRARDGYGGHSFNNSREYGGGYSNRHGTSRGRDRFGGGGGRGRSRDRY